MDDEDEDEYESDSEHTALVEETKEVPKAFTSQSMGQSMEDIKKADEILES